ncbi:MAG: RHS repeat-associated core domain-containing protein [Candidatus Acidiferrum sp.]
MSALARTSERDCRTRATNENCTASESWTRTKYVYDGIDLIEETSASGGVTARYLYGEGIDQSLAMLRSGTTNYYEADGLGSVTSLSNAAGALANNYAYDSLGNQVASAGSLVNSFRYTGREFDPETSLYYYRARYYDPATGRFMSEDPARYSGGTNFYLYVANNPVKRKDPLGLWQVTIGGGEGLGGLLTFGHNGGQWNFGLYSGGGVGLFGKLDPMDAGGCRKFGAHGAGTIQAEAGLGEFFSVGGGISVDASGSEPEMGFEGIIADIGGVAWNPNKPHEPPHGVLGGGEGGFAGVGFVFNSPPASKCGCGDK